MGSGWWELYGDKKEQEGLESEGSFLGVSEEHNPWIMTQRLETF